MLRATAPGVLSRGAFVSFNYMIYIDKVLRGLSDEIGQRARQPRECRKDIHSFLFPADLDGDTLGWDGDCNLTMVLCE